MLRKHWIIMTLIIAYFAGLAWVYMVWIIKPISKNQALEKELREVKALNAAYAQEKKKDYIYEIKIIYWQHADQVNINKWLRKHPGWEPIEVRVLTGMIPYFTVKRKIKIREGAH